MIYLSTTIATTTSPSTYALAQVEMAGEALHSAEDGGDQVAEQFTGSEVHSTIALSRRRVDVYVHDRGSACN